MRITIDTNIFVKAFDMSEYTIDCDSFIMGLFNKDSYSITLDYEDNIRKEYWDNLSSNERFIKIYTALEHKGRFTFESGKLNSKIKEKLISLGFQEAEDLVFVGVACNADKTIVTEDSDYGKGTNPKAQEAAKQAVLSYMINEVGLKIYDSVEAKNNI